MNDRVLSIVKRIARVHLKGKPPHLDEVRQALLREGYTPREIDAAFRWLDRSEEASGRGEESLPAERSARWRRAPGTRVTGPAMGFLQALRDLSYLDERSEEEVWHRVMAPGSGEIGLDRLRRVVAEVMFERHTDPGSEWVTLLDEEWKIVFH